MSVIVPVYQSAATLCHCLETLGRQKFPSFEVIVVDSGPGAGEWTSVCAAMPRAIYVHAPDQLNPQAARNVGARLANGELLAFTDPDIYPPPEWLSALVNAYERTHGIVLGSIACHGRRRLDLAAHLCKFNVCLPVPAGGHVPLGWSGNILMARHTFESLGGWDAAHTQGDATFTAHARSAGYPLWFEPDAVVYHDHAGVGLRAFLRERYARGCEFGELERRGELKGGPLVRHFPGDGVLPAPVTLACRATGRLVTIGRRAYEAGMLRDFLASLPVVAAGVAAWYLGLGVGGRRARNAVVGLDRKADTRAGAS